MFQKGLVILWFLGMLIVGLPLFVYLGISRLLVWKFVNEREASTAVEDVPGSAK